MLRVWQFDISNDSINDLNYWISTISRNNRLTLNRFNWIFKEKYWFIWRLIKFIPLFIMWSVVNLMDLLILSKFNRNSNIAFLNEICSMRASPSSTHIAQTHTSHPCIYWGNLWNGFSLAWISCGSFTMNVPLTTTQTCDLPPSHQHSTTHESVEVLNGRQRTAVSICATTHDSYINIVCMLKGRAWFSFILSTLRTKGSCIASMVQRIVRICRTVPVSV